MFKFSRILIAYAVAVPLACFLGYLVSSPTSSFTFEVIGIVLFFFAVPLFLKWHHTLLIVLWNSAFDAVFLPGRPHLWLLLAALSFGISFLNHIVFQKKFLQAPELTRPLLFLTAVVVGTALFRGGFGIRAFGGAAYGGRYYLFILLAIAGYFAFTAEPVPMAKSGKMAGLFFFSGTTYALSNIAYTLGPAFYFLYYLVPSDFAINQAASDVGLSNIDRITSLEPACQAAFCFLLARYGIRGLFDLAAPWRFFLLCLTVGAAFFAGFRSGMITLFMIFAFQFYFEGLLQTRYLPIVAGVAICGLAPILFFSASMPAPVQRAISFLPVNVDSEILEDAKGSSEWRFELWALAVKDLPKYLIIGKGYSVDPNELAMVSLGAQSGAQSTPYEGQLITGDYHSGPLSVIMPFGIFGMIGFIWVLAGGYRILSWNYRFGDARLRRINVTLLAFYLTNCISFFFIFGALSTGLSVFLGICGLSVSLNGGVKRRAAPRSKPAAVPQTMAMEPG
jgi:hypothetical protein